MQVLAIDLGTDLLPAMALGVEKPEPGVMRRPPRRRNQPLLDRGLMLRAVVFLGGIQTVLCYIGFFFVYSQFGYTDFLHLPSLAHLSFLERLGRPDGQVYMLATTVFHAGVVMAQIGNAFASRTITAKMRQVGVFSNMALLLAILFEVAIILLLIYLRPLNALFEHQPLPLVYWFGLALYGPIVYLLDWIRKIIVRRKPEPIYPASQSSTAPART
ncbi:MAG: cation-translocating P-type ATPase C-terminal domain-containing protein [Chloroflexi bacterium]|nr:cation-translocating P-type ATPase C-terminal domain-containing protein [Chloroflexota bacterium]